MTYVDNEILPSGDSMLGRARIYMAGMAASLHLKPRYMTDEQWRESKRMVSTIRRILKAVDGWQERASEIIGFDYEDEDSEKALSLVVEICDFDPDKEK